MSKPLPPDLVFLQWLIDEAGCLSPKPIPDNRWAAIIPKMFTHAIAVGPMFDYAGIDTHWCYKTRAQAQAALNAWDGRGEPEGWLRHPDTGRRRALEPGEVDEQGNVVEVGALYVRG